MESDLEHVLKKYALQNAIKYKGKATVKAVLGKVLADRPELRDSVSELKAQIGDIVNEVNERSIEAQINELTEIAPELLEQKKEVPRDKELPPLKNVGDKVVMRFAPGPSGPLHIGHARAAVLNDEYCKRYEGKLILRLEDTNPAKLNAEAYDMIKEDLNWLGVAYHEVIIQSERFDEYYHYAKKLLEMGHAYVCECDVEKWRELKGHGKACNDRDVEAGEQLERWEKLLDGTYTEGEASYIIKTDLGHPNPAVRDFIGFRIIDDPPHPMTGNKYRLYPLMNFSVSMDDHLLGLTHVLRGKDHLNNTFRQGYVHDYFGWTKPEYIHYGWVSIEDTILKTSEITQKISRGEIANWQDVRLGTFRALSRRGIRPEAVRKYWVDVGTKEVDVKFSWDTLYAYNRNLVDETAPRYFFVSEPVMLKLTGVDEIVGHAPIHPDFPERGVREVVLKKSEEAGIGLNITRDDWGEVRGSKLFRLKDLCNAAPSGEGSIEYKGNDISVLKGGDVKIVHWVSEVDHLRVGLVLPDGSMKVGFGESGMSAAVGRLVQFERVGFAMLQQAEPENKNVNEVEGRDKVELMASFAHK